MSSTLAVPLGLQVPRVRLVPRAVSSDVDDAVFLSTSYGLRPDEWQESVLDGWLGLRPDGRWAAPKCGLAVPRQNGKNGTVEVRELHGMSMRGERFLHTAHEVKTARKAFARLLSFFDNEREYPELAALVYEIRRTNGQEAIVLANGGSVEFIARSKGSGRGYSVDVLVCDEAQELTEDSLAALLPTISASPNPQQIFVGTPPGPNANGEVFGRLREAGLAGADFRLSWHEWSCDEKDLNLDDRSNWAKANPALGLRLHADTISDERSIMDDDTFARERLGVWAPPVNDAADIDLSGWKLLEDPSSRLESVLAFAVEVAIDRTAGAVGAAGPSSLDSRLHLEVVEHRRGVHWVVGRCQELDQRHGPASFVVDSAGPAASLIEPLQNAGLQVIVTTTADVAQLTADFIDALNERTIVHGPQVEVDQAIASVRKRSMGDGRFAFGRKASGSDISPLVAVALAKWGAQMQDLASQVF